LYAQVERRLPPKGEENAIRLLPLNNVSDILRSDWEVVDFIGELMVGLDRSNVRVDEDRGDICFL
jgi:hypothetical protein